MSFIYNHLKHIQGQAANVDWVNDDIRVALVMSNTTADTEDDKTLMNAFTTLDEMDGAGYARGALANEAWAKDVANNRSEFDADDLVFTSVSAGTRQVVGALLYKHVTNDTDSIPLAYINGTGFPFDPGGGNITFQWNAEGIVQHT